MSLSYLSEVADVRFKKLLDCLWRSVIIVQKLFTIPMQQQYKQDMSIRKLGYCKLVQKIMSLDSQFSRLFWPIARRSSSVVYTWVSKSIWCFIGTMHDWFTEARRCLTDTLGNIFPRFESAICIYVEFWLVRWSVGVLCHWPEGSLWFWFYDILLKTAVWSLTTYNLYSTIFFLGWEAVFGTI